MTCYARITVKGYKGDKLRASKNKTSEVYGILGLDKIDCIAYAMKMFEGGGYRMTTDISMEFSDFPIVSAHIQTPAYIDLQDKQKLAELLQKVKED